MPVPLFSTNGRPESWWLEATNSTGPGLTPWSSSTLKEVNLQYKITTEASRFLCLPFRQLGAGGGGGVNKLL
jgi:hypothetical protein